MTSLNESQSQPTSNTVNLLDEKILNQNESSDLAVGVSLGMAHLNLEVSYKFFFLSFKKVNLILFEV